MLSARYREGSGVELAGSPAALEGLAADLAAGRLITKPLAARAAQPHTAALLAIELRRSGGPLRLAVEQDTLVVSGAPVALYHLSKHLARFARVAPNEDAGAQLHLDWEPGREFIAEDSEPLLVAIDAP